MSPKKYMRPCSEWSAVDKPYCLNHASKVNQSFPPEGKLRIFPMIGNRLGPGGGGSPLERTFFLTFHIHRMGTEASKTYDRGCIVVIHRSLNGNFEVERCRARPYKYSQHHSISTHSITAWTLMFDIRQNLRMVTKTHLSKFILPIHAMAWLILQKPGGWHKRYAQINGGRVLCIDLSKSSSSYQ